MNIINIHWVSFQSLKKRQFFFLSETLKICYLSKIVLLNTSTAMVILRTKLLEIVNFYNCLNGDTKKMIKDDQSYKNVLANSF